MAENKASFVLYKDIIHTVKKMPKDKQADLFMTILEYVNDCNPTVDDILVDLVFEPIKQSLKRDLKKYEKTCERNRINGQKGGRPPETEEPKKPSGLNGNPVIKPEPKKADSDSDIDRDSDILSEYTEKEFLEDWGTIRKKLRNLPTNIPRLKPFDLINFNKYKKDYTREQFQEAMRGLFGQEVINFTSMITQPTHFLENVEKYYNAFISKDFKQYGSKQVQH